MVSDRLNILSVRLTFPLSIRLMSSTSLIRPSRCLLEIVILPSASKTRSLSSMCIPATAVMPRMAFIGVRMSWLIRDRKSLLAILADSARSAARASISFCFSSLWMISSILRMVSVMAVGSSPSISATVATVEHHSYFPFSSIRLYWSSMWSSVSRSFNIFGRARNA